MNLMRCRFEKDISIGRFKKIANLKRLSYFAGLNVCLFKTILLSFIENNEQNQLP